MTDKDLKNIYEYMGWDRDEIDSLKAELKTAKLDSHRLVWQEQENDNLRCCGNCDRWYSKTTCPHYQGCPSEYCDKWQSDGMTRKEREIHP